MSNWLSRIRSEPASAPAIPNSLDSSWLQSPSTPRTVPVPKQRDPNSPDYRYQVNQKCIYERRLPGGSYITAHVQRLQSGYYDSPVVHEDRIDNVRFVAINFVFHPSRTTFRFKSAEISIALHHTGEDHKNGLPLVGAALGAPRTSSHDHGTQTEALTHSRALVPSKDCLHHNGGFVPSKPRFLRHAPHLLYGSISPETLNWNFKLAGSLGVSQGPASASVNPSYGVKSSYKVYEMMKIQGSVRTLRSWYGRQYDIEDGELFWTLEENTLQKSGLPREFTFVMLLTKGSGGFEESGDVRLEVDINPKVMGRLGTTYPSFITNLHQYQPFKRGVLDLDEEVGQVFEPYIKGKGFNFANIASNFDDFVWLPGNAYSTSEPQYSSIGTGGNQQQAGPQQQQQQHQQQQLQLQQSPQRTRQQQAQAQPQQHQQQQQNPKPQQGLPPGDTTLNLRVFLEPSRGTNSSPIPWTTQMLQQQIQQHQHHLPTVNLKIPKNMSRNASPGIPAAGAAAAASSISRSASGSGASTTRRTVTIGSSKSVRKQRSRTELSKEYHSSPVQPRSATAVAAEQLRTPDPAPVSAPSNDGEVILRRRRTRDSAAAHAPAPRPFSYQDIEDVLGNGNGQHTGRDRSRPRDHSHNRDSVDVGTSPIFRAYTNHQFVIRSSDSNHSLPAMPQPPPQQHQQQEQEDDPPADLLVNGFRSSSEYTTPPTHVT